MFLRSPAFTHVHPDPVDALVAVVVTTLVALVSTVAATAFESRLAGGVLDASGAAHPVPVTRGA
jgi:hypothetical protein